ncbi:MAG: hypothetical protein GY751_15015 [Bacteroidetes bacterium]|nr:hypothetical protein [Bacteroidota bacterium]
MIKSRILFLILAAISFVVAATFTGLISYLVRTPANFIAALLSGSLMIYASVKLSKYNNWPVAVFALALLVVTMWAETPVKQMLQVSLSGSALDISPTAQQNFKHTAFFKFNDSYLDIENAGHTLVQYYGDHHYYAVPVMADIANQQQVRFWAWCRTKNPRNTNQLKRIFDEDLQYGLRIKDISIRRNVEKAIHAAVSERGIVVHQDPIILEWGVGKDNRPFINRLWVMFFSFMILVAAMVILEWVFSRRKKKKKADV